MGKSNGQASCNWKSAAMRLAMGIDRMFGSLDALVVHLLLVLAGTWIQRLAGL